MSPSRVTAIHPLSAIEGGRLTIEGSKFPVDGPILPEVRIGPQRARLVFASPTRLVAIVPPGLEAGRVTVRVGDGSGVTAFVDVGVPFAAGLHQVDNPVFDRDGNLYVTYSGTRGQQVPVSIFRVSASGIRDTRGEFGVCRLPQNGTVPDSRAEFSAKPKTCLWRRCVWRRLPGREGRLKLLNGKFPNPLPVRSGSKSRPAASVTAIRS